ncbi:hypothetical protein BGY98DRAFT_1030747, partial [Russula aff. rugulosa BPL654]
RCMIKCSCLVNFSGLSTMGRAGKLPFKPSSATSSTVPLALTHNPVPWKHSSQTLSMAVSVPESVWAARTVSGTAGWRRTRISK